MGVKRSTQQETGHLFQKRVEWVDRAWILYHKISVLDAYNLSAGKDGRLVKSYTTDLVVFRDGSVWLADVEGDDVLKLPEFPVAAPGDGRHLGRHGVVWGQVHPGQGVQGWWTDRTGLVNRPHWDGGQTALGWWTDRTGLVDKSCGQATLGWWINRVGTPHRVSEEIVWTVHTGLVDRPYWVGGQTAMG